MVGTSPHEVEGGDEDSEGDQGPPDRGGLECDLEGTCLGLHGTFSLQFGFVFEGRGLRAQLSGCLAVGLACALWWLFLVRCGWNVAVWGGKGWCGGDV